MWLMMLVAAILELWFVVDRPRHLKEESIHMEVPVKPPSFFSEHLDDFSKVLARVEAADKLKLEAINLLRCGKDQPNNGGKCVNKGHCCTKHGFCVNDWDPCLKRNGCQGQYNGVNETDPDGKQKNCYDDQCDQGNKCPTAYTCCLNKKNIKDPDKGYTTCGARHCRNAKFCDQEGSWNGSTCVKNPTCGRENKDFKCEEEGTCCTSTGTCVHALDDKGNLKQDCEFEVGRCQPGYSADDKDEKELTLARIMDHTIENSCYMGCGPGFGERSCRPGLCCVKGRCTVNDCPRADENGNCEHEPCAPFLPKPGSPDTTNPDGNAPLAPGP